MWYHSWGQVTEDDLPLTGCSRSVGRVPQAHATVDHPRRQRLEETTSFQGMGLSPEQQAAVEALGWAEPTPIQVKAIPSGMEGKDIVGIAQTGTGKTGAFILPTLERAEGGGGLQILVLCPTRELAQQVADDAVALARGTTLRAAVIVGGVAYGPQREALENGVELISATPGRFIDHMGRGQVDLRRVRALILDEADRMLDMGFPAPDRRHSEEGSAGSADHALFRDDASRRTRACATDHQGSGLGRGGPCGYDGRRNRGARLFGQTRHESESPHRSIVRRGVESSTGLHPDQGGGRHPTDPTRARGHLGRRDALGSANATSYAGVGPVRVP